MSIDLGPNEYQQDCDENGLIDTVDIAASPALDCDLDGVLDSCQPWTDCNQSGMNDRCEIAAGLLPDCNKNRIPDSCDLASGLSIDVDGNGVPFECDNLIIRVRSGSWGESGLSWEDANPRLRDVLAFAATRFGTTEIWVAAGRHDPGEPGEPKRSYEIPPRVSMYGGFAGTEDFREQRDPKRNVTVLTGDCMGDDVWPPTSYIPAERFDNSTNVVRVRGDAGSPVIDGFVIAGGHAIGPRAAGAVTHLLNYSLTDRDAGGLLVYDGAIPQVKNCVFRNNVSGQRGGAVVGVGSFVQCVFEENSSGNAGALVAMGGTQLLNCVFRRNIASDGGAAYVEAGPPSSVVNCLFVGNTGTHGCGALRVWRQPGTGSQIQCRVVNCAIVGNSSMMRSALFGNGITTLANSIVAHNTSPGFTLFQAQVGGPASSYSWTHNCITGYTGQFPGEGNIGLDPLFLDADGLDNVYGTSDDDLRLARGSPCFDAGSNAAIGLEELPIDFAGNARRMDDPHAPDTGTGEFPIVDMGALERISSDCPDANGDGDTDQLDLSVLLATYGLAVPGGSGADFNGDGVVNSADLSALLGHFGQACPL